MEYWRPEEIKFIDRNDELIDSTGGIITDKLANAISNSDEISDSTLIFILKFLYGLYRINGFRLLVNNEESGVKYKTSLAIIPNRNYVDGVARDLKLLDWDDTFDPSMDLDKRLESLKDSLIGILDTEYEGILLPHEDKIFREILNSAKILVED